MHSAPQPREIVTARLLGDPPPDLAQRRAEAEERAAHLHQRQAAA